MTTFRKTLHQLATEQDVRERERLSDLFASQLELAFNQQGNQAQLAISDTEDVLLEKIDRLNEQVGNNNLLLATFLERFPPQFDQFQAEARAAWEGTARQIKKLEAGQRAIDRRAKDYYEQNAARIDEVKVEVARQGTLVDARPAQREAEKQERMDWQAMIEQRVSALEVARLAAEQRDGE